MMLLAAAICELLVLTIPLIDSVPIPTTPAVTKTMKVTKSVYSIKSWPSSSCHKVCSNCIRDYLQGYYNRSQIEDQAKYQ